jgi:hypothetical protein
MSSYSSVLKQEVFPWTWLAVNGIPDYPQKAVKNRVFMPYKIGISTHKYKLGLNLK